MRRWLVAGMFLTLLVPSTAAGADSLVLVKDSLLPTLAGEAKVWQTPQAVIDVQGSRETVQAFARFPEDPGKGYSLLLDPPPGKQLTAGAVYDNIPEGLGSETARLGIAGEGLYCSGG